MRTTWNGSLSFGLVSIPVGLAPATKPAARQSDVSFRLLHRECATPIKQKRWCPTHDREVTQDEIVRGFEVTKGQFLIVEDADLEAIERADDSRSIEITRFVKQDDVDPIFFDRTYFLVPAAATAQRRPYVLLLEAMRQTETAALGRFVRAGRESLCLVRARDGALALETLFLAEDVYSQAEIAEAVEETKVKKSELDLARQVIDSLAGEFEPTELASEYRRDLRALLEAKMRGEEIVAPEPVEVAPVIDLMEALKASVAAAKKQPRAGGEARAHAQGAHQGELETGGTRERQDAARTLEHERGHSAAPGRTSMGRESTPSQSDSSSASPSSSTRTMAASGELAVLPGNDAGSRPFDEERKPGTTRRLLDARAPPLDPLAGGRRSRSVGDVETEPRRTGIEIVRANGPPDRPATGAHGLGHPATERAPARFALVHDGHQLDVGITERNDPVGRPPARMSTALVRLETVLPRQARRARRRDREQDVVELHGPAGRASALRHEAVAEAPAADPTDSSEAWKSVLSILPW